MSGDRGSHSRMGGFGYVESTVGCVDLAVHSRGSTSFCDISLSLSFSEPSLPQMHGLARWGDVVIALSVGDFLNIS